MTGRDVLMMIMGGASTMAVAIVLRHLYWNWKK